MPTHLSERRAEWTVRLARALREEGVPCTTTETVVADVALDVLDLGDAVDVYFGLKPVFVCDREHGPIFDRVFWRLWGQRQGGRVETVDRPTSGEPEDRAAPGDPSVGPGEESILHRLTRADESPPESASETVPERAVYSARERLTRRSFDSLDERELERLDRALDRLLLRLAVRRSRRYQPAKRRGRPDLRRSFRSAIAHDGELIRLARRSRKVQRPRLVLLCDISGSMERYSRFLLRFLLAAGRGRDVESFVFSTRLTRLTPWLAAARLDDALRQVGRQVHDWSGGTRIGECLGEFVERHGRALLGRRTIVIILSDGLDRGDVGLLERAMRSIQRRARKVIWLNPLLESPRYQPEARGMRAALPHVDVFAAGHNLESLLELERHLTLR